MRYLLFIFVFLYSFSCNKPAKNNGLREFKHINEIYDVKKGKYIYSYSRIPLDSIEVNLLSKILTKRRIEHFLERGKVFYKPKTYLDIKSEFDIDRELIDSIIISGAIKSSFVQNLIDSLGIE